jgi:hypothetical protein
MYKRMHAHVCIKDSRNHPPGHAQASAYKGTHARAHRRCRPRTTGRAASMPSRARPEQMRWPCGGAPPGRKGGAYIGQRGDRHGVPRADVRVERIRTVEYLRAGAPRGPRRSDSARMCRREYVRARTHTHTRAHISGHVRVRAARIHQRSDPPCSDAHRCGYVHLLCPSIPYVLVPWIWPYEERASHSRTCRARAASCAHARQHTCVHRGHHYLHARTCA